MIARPPDRSVWLEVARRRVLRVASTYLALTFAGAEACLALLPLAGAPGWFWRVALGLAVMGFPVAVVLAWTYDITPTGVVKTPAELDPDNNMGEPSRGWLVLTIVGLIAGLVIEAVRH